MSEKNPTNGATPINTVQAGSDKYLVDVYIAAPGTPLNLEKGQTSLPGHMYYGLRHGNESISLGFAPKAHGDSNGPGKVYDDDVANYQNPLFKRTMEISKEQYFKLKEFGENPAAQGFDMKYSGVGNSCVDFTYKALEHAGIEQKRGVGYYVEQGLKYSSPLAGALFTDYKPTQNIENVRNLKAPIPDSKLNTESTNPMPPRTALQRALSQNEMQAPNKILPLEGAPLTPKLASADKPSAGSPNWANISEPIVVANKDGTSTHIQRGVGGHIVSMQNFDANGAEINPRAAALDQNQPKPNLPEQQQMRMTA
jgi:hypothetical protein